jgi:RNA 2',3'-cyclic 3'-phosphodiesterase
VRAFIGTFLSSANQGVSDAFGRRLADASLSLLRPVPPRSAHITHAFLGDVDDALVEVVIGNLLDLLRSIAPVPFRLGRPELLRAGREPRLLLAKVEAGAAEVSDVTRRIVDRLRQHAALAGIAAARSPHVTLARFRRGAGSKDTSQSGNILANPHADPDWAEDRLDEIQLIQSELTPRGPVYQVVARAPAGRVA